MNYSRILLAVIILLFSSLSLKGQDQQPIQEVHGLQHAGGIHFYSSPGILEVTVFKQDGKGNSNNQIMHAMLLGPDGSTLDSARLYGNTEKTLKYSIENAGIYTVLLSMNNDQSIRSVTWGFKTRTPLFMINSSTGHTDRSRTEPIILNGGKHPFGIYFKPQKKKFRISASDLPEGANKLYVFDGRDKLIKEIAVKDNKIDETIDCGACDGVWELRLPQQKGTINIEGITFGWAEDRLPLSVWTSSRESYFDVGNYHWLLGPRRFARNVRAGEEGEVKFSLFNNSNEDMLLSMELAQTPEIGQFSLSSRELTLPANTTSQLYVRYHLDPTIRKGTYGMQLIAKDRRTNKQSFSHLELRADTQKTIDLPIELKLFEHDQFQFAYEPSYPRDNQFYFDSENKPWLVSADGLKVKSAGSWKTISLPDNKEDVRYPTSTIGTDNQTNVFTIVNIKSLPHLMRVNGQNFEVELIPLPRGGTYKMETYMGGRISKYPPAIVRYVLDTKQKQISKWARVHRLELLLVNTTDGKLHVEDPILISNNCVGTSDHSGITNSIAADGDELHLIWGATSDPEKKDKGVPTYLVSYNRKSKSLSLPSLLAYSPPVNDVHNMSSILIDSKGTKHVIIGAHGRPFQYLNQLENSTEWFGPSPISELGQTYVGAVLDTKDGIHLFCRTWRNGTNYPGIFDASLFFQRMQEGSHKWEEQQPFALPALPGYTVYYHRLTVDRNGKLYLSMDYWPTWSIYRESYRDSAEKTRLGKNRLLFTSDNGEDWDLATDIN